jgi:hypothetical protein
MKYHHVLISTRQSMLENEDKAFDSVLTLMLISQFFPLCYILCPNSGGYPYPISKLKN